ncbi:sure-like protein [Laetiporus sulphureus 93-53]|uniref:Sure-like protein n=1 Tax=Laetiporus sulphureus 93-53 TaxID=1314785 RepID=A0A165DP02_9APHY|nr:sure-like protein [Laetiporus sulphureus 93-53]KZT05305.1 sure-like protein [Laetiporus sulphureus 93-53]
MPLVLKALFALLCAVAIVAQDIVLTNDDGWAVAQIRAQYAALTGAGFDVVLSAPAENKSGTGSWSAPPTPLVEPCEYDSCPAGSPPEGYNASDPHLNYVNSYPVDAARYGVQALAPEIFGDSGPDFVVSGPNIGNNLGLITLFSGTIGAAAEAVKLGVSSGAFSGASGSHVSYTTLESSPDATSTLSALLYSSLTVHFAETLFNSGYSPILPAGVLVNVNYPSIDDCSDVSDYKWVFARNLYNIFATDVQTCGSTTLPTERSVVDTSGCYASVSVISAETKMDVSSTVQAAVLERLSALPLSCLPS